jgi:serine/threonine protein phosphatase PrpC
MISHFTAHTASLKGIRESNEDKHIVILNLDNKDINKAPVNFMGVFDGHGGKFVSKFLEKNISTFFTDKRVLYPLSKKYINAVYDYIQEYLKDKYYNKAYECGSTSVVAIHYRQNDSNYLNVFNVGDSRCIICRDNKAIPLTIDHKPNLPSEKKRIEELGGKIYYDGADWRVNDLSLSRAFGDIESTPYVTCSPDIFKYKLEKTDQFVVLACDGLWDVMTEQEVCDFIINLAFDKQNNKIINKNLNIAKKLAEYAIQKGSSDNVSVVIYFL